MMLSSLMDHCLFSAHMVTMVMINICVLFSTAGPTDEGGERGGRDFLGAAKPGLCRCAAHTKFYKGIS